VDNFYHIVIQKSIPALLDTSQKQNLFYLTMIYFFIKLF